MSPGLSNLLLILALGAVAVSARADETNIFSDPGDGLKDRTDLLKNDSQRQLDTGNYNAPHHFFNDYSPSLPLPRPVFLGNPDAATQDAINKRKNWMLLTPEQILGVQTPEDMLGKKKTDSDKNLSLEEQYLLRESQPVANTSTNGRSGSPMSWRDSSNPFSQNNDDNDDRPLFSRGAFASPDDQSQPDSTRYFKQFLKANTGNGNSRDNNKQKQATAWTSVFAQPAQPKQTPAQLADMERFRAMMEPISPPDKSSDKTPTIKTSFSTTPAPDADSLFQPQPIFNPAGRSVALIQDGITRPVGIKPLSGITGPEKIAPEAKPAWQAQLPPWLSDGPQGHAANRNF